LDNILATQTSLTATLAGVTVRAAATLDFDPVDPAPAAGIDTNDSLQYKRPVKMVGLSSGAITPRISTMKKRSDLRGVSSSADVAPMVGGL
jgi:hypothetical protein